MPRFRDSPRLPQEARFASSDLPGVQAQPSPPRQLRCGDVQVRVQAREHADLLHLLRHGRLARRRPFPRVHRRARRGERREGDHGRGVHAGPVVAGIDANFLDDYTGISINLPTSRPPHRRHRRLGRPRRARSTGSRTVWGEHRARWDSSASSAVRRPSASMTSVPAARVLTTHNQGWRDGQLRHRPRRRPKPPRTRAFIRQIPALP